MEAGVWNAQIMLIAALAEDYVTMAEVVKDWRNARFCSITASPLLLLARLVWRLASVLSAGIPVIVFIPKGL